jgi:hypothetical protein
MAHTVSNTKITAPESTANVPSERRVRDVADRIAYLDPNAAPLTLLTQKASSFSVYNTKFEWIEKDLEARWSQVNNGAGYNTTATSIVVDNGNYFTVGDLVKVPRTGEVFRVTAVSTNTLTVVRGLGNGGTGVALLDNDDLLILGSSFAEGAASGSEKSHIETYPYNYTQIIRTPFGVTGSENSSENYTGNDRSRLRAEKAIQHKIDIERTALFGVRDIDTSSTANPIRYTGGFLYYATSNSKDMGGTMTLSEVETWCESLFSHTASGDTRVVFMSPLVTSVIDQLAINAVRLVPSDKTFGIAVRELVTAHGTLMLVKHRLLTSGPSGSGGYGGYMLAVDPSKFGYAYLRGRNTKLRMDIQSPDVDGFKDEYLTEFGWRLQNPLVHGYAYNITG